MGLGGGAVPVDIDVLFIGLLFDGTATTGEVVGPMDTTFSDIFSSFFLMADALMAAKQAGQR